MAVAALKRLLGGFTPVAALSVLLLVALYLMSGATENSAQFGRLYSLLLIVNALGLAILFVLIGSHLYRLVRQYRRRAMGSRMTLRLVTMFVILAVLPVSVVYYFSVHFLHRGIDSWFDVRIEQALEDALELGRSALDLRMRELLRKTEEMAGELAQTPTELAAVSLNDLRGRSSASELTLLARNGRIIASSTADPTIIVPDRPDEAILLQIRQGRSYVGLDPISDTGLHVRAVVGVPFTEPRAQGGDILQALFPIPERPSMLAASVQTAYAQYKELAYLRKPLKQSFTLTLSLVLLLSLLTAVLSAFFSARRLVAPIQDLAEGTRAVAEGDYDKQLPMPGNDEMGLLVVSFNEMTRRIALARDAERHSQRQLERQRAFLEAVLGRLSSGVLIVNLDQVLRTANSAASQILGVALDAYLGRSLEQIGAGQPRLHNLVDALQPHVRNGGHDWREEVTLSGAEGRQVLMCRGTLLPGVGDLEGGGHVIVFDDITLMIQGQREAAWGEVARRLAHEIKNPLTPIQLSAERLRHKYLKTMPEQDAKVLDRLTHTIVQQVEVMKEMVRDFSEYARTPETQLLPLDLNALVNEVLDLYRGQKTGIQVQVDLDPAMPRIDADSGRLRQVLHNLIKNAMEATEHSAKARIVISTRCVEDAACRFVELRVADNGPGIPKEILGRIFEPYVTTKPKGTGLGLSIVKKIVEEHGGVLWAENLEPRGASVNIRLPVRDAGQRPGPAGRAA